MKIEIEDTNREAAVGPGVITDAGYDAWFRAKCQEALVGRGPQGAPGNG